MGDAVVMVGARHGLCVHAYSSGGNATNSSDTVLLGYMLQIFVHKSVVEQFAYPSQPMGIPIKRSISDYITKDGVAADGQARILFHPNLFLDPSLVRLYHYCA